MEILPGLLIDYIESVEMISLLYCVDVKANPMPLSGGTSSSRQCE